MISNTTQAILALADTLPGGREAFLAEIAPIVGDKIYFSAESVAERYDVSLSCVKKWRESGKLKPSLKVGEGTARYSLADLIGFEQANGSGKERA